MKKGIILIALVFSVFILAGQSFSSDLFLNTINESCGTHYSCNICHKDSQGGGDLKSNSAFTVTKSYEPCAFCKESCWDMSARKH